MSSCVLLRWSFVRWFVTGVGAAALVACQARSVEAPRINPERVIHHDIPISQNRDIDLLFMVDKSPTMADEQASLAANFPRFINVLQNIPGGLPNVHIGVITQDIGAGGFSTGGTCTGAGDAGRLQAAPRVAGCTPPSGAFISDVAGSEGTRQTNYAGTLADTFACIAQVGPDGCGFEQHLESLKRALDGSVPENAGFLRKDAYLGIIILSDEDDCSAFDGERVQSDKRVADRSPRPAVGFPLRRVRLDLRRRPGGAGLRRLRQLRPPGEFAVPEPSPEVRRVHPGPEERSQPDHRGGDHRRRRPVRGRADQRLVHEPRGQTCLHEGHPERRADAAHPALHGAVPGSEQLRLHLRRGPGARTGGHRPAAGAGDRQPLPERSGGHARSRIPPSPGYSSTVRPRRAAPRTASGGKSSRCPVA